MTKAGVIATTIAIAIIAISITFATGTRLPDRHCVMTLSKPYAGKMHYIPVCR